MSAIDQLDYVEKFYNMNLNTFGIDRSNGITAGDLYAINFLPAVAKNEVLCTTSDSLSWAYNANSGLDLDGDGRITKTDLTNRIRGKYNELLQDYGVSG